MTLLLEFLAQDAGTVIGVGPLPIFHKAESAIDVKVVELAIGLGHGKSEFVGFILPGAGLDFFQKQAADATPLQIRIDGELGEVRNLRP